MKDPQFHAEALEDAPDPEVHQERKILRHMERVATLIKNEFLDAHVLLDYASEFITLNWQQLEPLVLEPPRYGECGIMGEVRVHCDEGAPVE